MTKHYGKIVDRFAAEIRTGTARAGITVTDRDQRTGISPATMRKRTMYPTGMTLGEVLRLNGVIGLNPITVLYLCGYSLRDIEEAIKEEKK